MHNSICIYIIIQLNKLEDIPVCADQYWDSHTKNSINEVEMIQNRTISFVSNLMGRVHRPIMQRTWMFDEERQ